MVRALKPTADDCIQHILYRVPRWSEGDLAGFLKGCSITSSRRSCRNSGFHKQMFLRRHHMDDVVKSLFERQPPKAPTPKSGTPTIKAATPARPTREEAEAAVRVLLRWAGDDPNREGLLATPQRVVKAYEEFFAGYRADPSDVLARVFEEVQGYDDLVLVR